MKENNFLKRENIPNIILIILIFVMGVLFVFINLMRYKAGLNADITAEGLLAKIIWESKQWIPDEWYFSTEARLISVANCAALFYGITKNVCLSMGLACTVAATFILGSLWYLCKQLSFKMSERLLVIFLVMMLPNNRIMIELMFIHAGHYAFHVGLYFLTLALYIKMLKRDKVRSVEIIINLLFHFVVGAQGTRGILMITGPLMAVEILRRIYAWWCQKGEKRGNTIITIFVIGTNVVGYLGGKIPLSVKLPISRNIRRAPQKFMEDVIPNFLNAFAWEQISPIEKMIYMISLALIIYLAIDIIVKGIKKKEIEIEKWLFLNFFVSLFLTIMAMTFTTMGSSNRYYLAVYFAMAVGITILMGCSNRILKSCLIFMICVLFIGNLGRVYYPLVTDRSYEQNAFIQVGEYLVQEGYEYGYSDFVNANTITVYSDEKIQVSAIDSFSEMNICKWLTSKKWYVPNVPENSKTAYIVPDHKLTEIEEFLEKHPGAIEFKTQIMHLYIYGSDYNYSKLTD